MAESATAQKIKELLQSDVELNAYLGILKAHKRQLPQAVQAIDLRGHIWRVGSMWPLAGVPAIVAEIYDLVDRVEVVGMPLTQDQVDALDEPNRKHVADIDGHVRAWVSRAAGACDSPVHVIPAAANGGVTIRFAGAADGDLPEIARYSCRLLRYSVHKYLMEAGLIRVVEPEEEPDACDKCGHEVKDEDVTCPGCGVKLDEDEPPTPTNGTPTPPAPVATP